MTVEEIRAWIEYDARERERRERLYRYYTVKNRILDEPKKDDDKPDNRLAHGFVNYICRAYTGYMFGEPVTYAAKAGETPEEAALAEGLDAEIRACYEYNDEQSENSALGLDCSICGAAVEILYVDADAKARFARVNPVGCIAITDGALEEALTALIRYYDRWDVPNRQWVRTVEVYDAETVTTYRSVGGEQNVFGEPEIKPHYFGDVPAVVFKNEPFGMGDAEGVLSQIDAYDRMQSDGVNDQQYFTDAYLAMYGVGELDADSAKSMRRNRLLLMPGMDTKAEWLVKQQSDTTPENIKKRLNNDIHRMSACPDMTDESFAGNASGVALSYKLLQFENVAGIKEGEFRKGLQRRLELLCNLWRLKGLPEYDWRSVKITFHRSLPQNLLELSQVVSNLGDVVSDETKRSLLPLDIDEATEKQRLDEEGAGGLFTRWEMKHPETVEELETEGEEVE